jgi:hypothetical protein
MKRKHISAEELDRIFDEGKEDVLQYFDLSKGRRPGLEIKRVNVDLPQWMIDALDREAARLGITRQAVIKTWLGERIEAQRARHAAVAEAPPTKQRRVAETQRRYRTTRKRN